jgi:alpha-beta hydrolase superfamily lysophospholipase
MKSRLRRVGLTAIAAGALVAIACGAVLFLREYFSFDPPRRSASEADARRVIPAFENVSWLSGGHAVRGWLARGAERAAIIVLHGYGGHRGDMLREIGMLAARGFTLLAFDWPGHGDSGGTVSDEEARSALEGALDFVTATEGVDTARIGAFGFSMGGYILVQRAAIDRRLKAVAIAGAMADAMDFARWEYRDYGPFAHWPAWLAMRARGMNPSQAPPVDVVARIAPRSILVITGEQDAVVPTHMTTALFAAAKAPKQLLSLPQAGHGDYAAVAPELYAATLVSFFSKHLLIEHP